MTFLLNVRWLENVCMGKAMNSRKKRRINGIATLLSMGNIQGWAKAVKLKNKIMPSKLYHYRSVAVEPDKDRLQ